MTLETLEAMLALVVFVFGLFLGMELGQAILDRRSRKKYAKWFDNNRR